MLRVVFATFCKVSRRRRRVLANDALLTVITKASPCRPTLDSDPNSFRMYAFNAAISSGCFGECLPSKSFKLSTTCSINNSDMLDHGIILEVIRKQTLK